MSQDRFLTEYIKTNNDPSFDDFFMEQYEAILAASVNQVKLKPDDIFSLWKTRYAMELRKQGKTELIVQKKTAFDKAKWTEFKKSLEALVIARSRYQTEGLVSLANVASSSSSILTNALADSTPTAHSAPPASTPDIAQEPSSSSTPGSLFDQIFESQNDNGMLLPDCVLGSSDLDYQLHHWAYKKLDEGLTTKELNLINQLTFDMTTMKGMLQNLVAQKLTSESTNYIDEEAIKLWVSGIVNLIHPDMASMVLTTAPDQLKPLLDYKHDLADLDEETVAHLEHIMALGDAIPAILRYLMVAKIKLIDDDKITSPAFVNLRIIEEIVQNIALWSPKHDESEASYYRRFASILDILLADLDIALVDGEPALAASKTPIEVNKAIFGTKESAPAYGRKIDLIFRCNRSATKVDLSCNEWKKTNVRHGIKLHQQSKNLRSNTCNLLKLNNSFGLKSSIALDFVGNSGYMYILRLLETEDPDDAITVAHCIGDLSIAEDVASLDSLGKMLRCLWTLKGILGAMTKQVMRELAKDQHARNISSICQLPSTRGPSKQPFTRDDQPKSEAMPKSTKNDACAQKL
ncbi:hypothetical protein DM01DRAFT_1379995 [Hesseltinella vesiculosa]|uniref:Uncharacterized protein n=1 Tax=Hesseltinella vesiculosa TaxID=101127 RepID=A0A1X2GVZ4_9FUNG|nr:hypothetical protein DM01DRAFT_1379995 [Hesseltinella vesiculosa]